MTLPGRPRQKLNKPRPEGTLKEAIARLVYACGGTTRVADLLGLSQSQAQRYTDPMSDTEMRPSQIRTLEMACGQPIVTEFLAAESGFALVPMHATNGKSLPIHMAKVGAAAAKLFEQFAKAMEDGGIQPREAARIHGKAMPVIGALGHVIAVCRTMMREETK